LGLLPDRTHGADNFGMAHTAQMQDAKLIRISAKRNLQQMKHLTHFASGSQSKNSP
jgi:hypothetical protein